jgi:hypothetical protein
VIDNPIRAGIGRCLRSGPRREVVWRWPTGNTRCSRELADSFARDHPCGVAQAPSPEASPKSKESTAIAMHQVGPQRVAPSGRRNRAASRPLPMMSRTAALAIVLATTSGVFAQTTPPSSCATTNSPGQNLSDKLSGSAGAICPPNVDPGMKAPTPRTGDTPAIPAPGTPGGNPNVQPKP